MLETQITSVQGSSQGFVEFYNYYTVFREGAIRNPVNSVKGRRFVLSEVLN